AARAGTGHVDHLDIDAAYGHVLDGLAQFAGGKGFEADLAAPAVDVIEDGAAGRADGQLQLGVFRPQAEDGVAEVVARALAPALGSRPGYRLLRVVGKAERVEELVERLRVRRDRVRRPNELDEPALLAAGQDGREHADIALEDWRPGGRH